MVEASLTDDHGARRLAAEMFLTVAGPSLVKSVAEILGARRIPVMPLKGVLLQRLVYRDGTFRPISDVDLLVPESRFFEACTTLRASGFVATSWAKGGWQVTIKNPKGPPLAIDLHRLLTRTHRSRLTSQGLFERGKTDTRLFDTPVVIPSPNDLFAHLLLHATLDWITRGQFHKLGDFQAVADALALDVSGCADHLKRHGLSIHALVILPVIRAEVGGAFVEALLPRIEATARVAATASMIRAATHRFDVGHPARRLAGVAVAPSLVAALLSAARDRLNQPLRAKVA